METLENFINSDIENISDNSFKSYVKPEIPINKANAAIISYATSITYEEVLILFDDTVWGSAKNGLIITETSIYAKKLMTEAIAIDLSEINNIEVNKGNLYINNNLFIDLDMPENSDVDKIFRKISEYLKLDSNHNLKDKDKIENIIKRFYFVNNRETYIKFLNKEMLNKQQLAFYSNIFLLGCSISFFHENCKDYPEELAYLLYDDNVILESYVYIAYITQKLLRTNNISRDQLGSILEPIFLIPGSYALYKHKKNDNLTLAETINPVQESKEMSHFFGKLKSYAYTHENHTRRNFIEDTLSAIMDIKNLDNDIYNRFQEEYLLEHAIQIEQNVEKLLIEYFTSV